MDETLGASDDDGMADSPSELPGLPDSPVGRQVAWFFDHAATRGEGLTLAEVGAHMAMPAPWDPAQGLKGFSSGDGQPFRVEKIAVSSPYALDITLDYGDGKPTKVSFAVEEEPPHRIVRMWWARAIPDDIVIRRASAVDAAALNDLEMRAPMTLGTTTLVYDRGADFLAFTRLMEENVCFVAERDGELLGLACGAAHRVRIGGADYTVMLLHHLRVPVAHRKGGVFSTLNGHVFGAYHARTDGAYGYTALDNAEAMRISGPGTWTTGVFRAVIDCASAAGPAHGRTASPGDAELLVDILNRGHANEEVYLPYTVDTLTARLERAPDLYTWRDITIGDGAAVGLWRAGLRVTVSDGHTEVHATRAVVLDHGFVPGADPEFERLLRGRCGQLLAEDHTELTFLTSIGSPNYGIVAGLARQLDPFAFRMAVPEPDGTTDRGLYVDAVYF